MKETKDSNERFHSNFNVKLKQVIKDSVFWYIVKRSPLKVRKFGSFVSVCFMLIPCLAYTSTPKMEVSCSSKTSTDFQRITRSFIPETLHHNLCDSLKSYVYTISDLIIHHVTKTVQNVRRRPESTSEHGVSLKWLATLCVEAARCLFGPAQFRFRLRSHRKGNGSDRIGPMSRRPVGRNKYLPYFTFILTVSLSS
jgi:hypothetical protein